MKKFLTFLMGLVFFASCTPDVSMNPADYQVQLYNYNFEQMVGGPVHPENTWGFGQSSSVMRGTNMNANTWSNDWDCIPNVNLTDDELAELKALLSPGTETYNTNIFPYENYWVSQVYKGQAPDEEYTATDRDGKATGTKVTGSQQMDKLTAMNGQYEHINNFNYGSNNNSVYDAGFTDPNTGSHNHEGTTLMVNMSLEGITATNQFGFHESFSNADYNNYLIVYYKGYWYVGFDYEMHKNVNNPGEAKDVNRDWKFTDWIVRITPAYAKGTTPEEDDLTPVGPNGLRIMGEDLGTTDDFDFNDIVIDIEILANGNAKATLQAAGGTMPIYIGSTNDFEIHDLFGVPTTTMVNTGRGTECDPVTFIVPGNYSNVNEVEIRVLSQLFGERTLSAEAGAAPQKFACPVGTPWAKERVNIMVAYPQFSQWATENTPSDWYTFPVTEYLY